MFLPIITLRIEGQKNIQISEEEFISCPVVTGFSPRIVNISNIEDVSAEPYTFYVSEHARELFPNLATPFIFEGLKVKLTRIPMGDLSGKISFFEIYLPTTEFDLIFSGLRKQFEEDTLEETEEEEE